MEKLVRLTMLIFFLFFNSQYCHAQNASRQKLSLGVYPLHLQTEGRNTFYMTNLSYDYKLNNSQNGFALGAFATYIRWGSPKITETVLGPRISYMYHENKMTLFVGSGVGYGWRTGPSGAEASNVRLKYNVGAAYRVFKATDLYVEASNYRSQTPTRFGFWPMIGVSTQF